MSQCTLLQDVRFGLGDERGDLLMAGGRVLHAGPPLDPAALGELIDPIGLGDLHRLAADGRRVLPGLVDHHVHADQWSLLSSWVDVRHATGPDQVVAALRDTVAAKGPGDRPVVAFGFRDGLWDTPPHRGLLDAVSDRIPIVVVGMDLHQCWLNTAALHRYRFEVTEATDGVVRETEWLPVLTDLRTLPADVMDGHVLTAMRAAAACGVTRITDFETADNPTSWTRRAAAGPLPVRVHAAVWPEHLQHALDRGLRTGAVLDADGSHPGRVLMGPLKVISDGSLNTRTAFCHDRYPDSAGSPHPYGRQLVAPDELESLLGRARRGGLRCAIHAIGDRANTDVLDAFAATGARGSIEHAQLLVPDDVPRFAELGLVASVQPEHAMDDRDIADRHWPGRTDRAFVLRSLLDAGVRLAFGSDAPVAPLDPWAAISAAVSRSRDGREPWHPDQRIGLAEAIAASTHTGATRPRVGDPADVVLVDTDLTATDGAGLRRCEIAGTWVGGLSTTG